MARRSALLAPTRPWDTLRDLVGVLFGISRPGDGENNRAWVEAVLTHLDTSITPAAVTIHDESDGDAIIVSPRDPIDGSSQGRSCDGETLAWVSGRVSGPFDSADGVASRFDREGIHAFRDAIGSYVALLVTRRPEGLTLVRGRSGQRTVFHARLIGGGFAFATDAAWLALHPALGFSLDETAMAEQLSFGSIFGERTLVRGVLRLPAGAACVHDDVTDRTTVMPVDEHPESDEIEDEGDALAALDDALASAMERAVAGPQPVALCLSSGLGSRLLLAVAARRDMPLDCITDGMPRGSELARARRIAETAGARPIPCPFEPKFLTEFDALASRLAFWTCGEAALVDMAMLDQGNRYRREHALDSVIRGHGSRLLHGPGTDVFGVDLELARSERYDVARQRILERLRDPVAERELPGLARGALADALPESGSRSFTQHYDALAAGCANVGQAVSRFYLSHIGARTIANTVRCMTQRIEVALPLLDEDVTRTLLRMPMPLRARVDLRIELIRRNHPALLAIPDSALGVSPVASPMKRFLARKLWPIRRGLGLIREDGPGDRLIEPMNSLFESVLLDERCLTRGHFDPDGLTSLIRRRRRGERSLDGLLGRLTILESMVRDRPLNRFLDE